MHVKFTHSDFLSGKDQNDKTKGANFPAKVQNVFGKKIPISFLFMAVPFLEVSITMSPIQQISVR